MDTDKRQKLEFFRYELQDRMSHLEFLIAHLASEERHLNDLGRSGCSGHCERCGESHDGRGWSNVSKSRYVISQARGSIDRLTEELRRLVETIEDIEKDARFRERASQSLHPCESV